MLLTFHYKEASSLSSSNMFPTSCRSCFLSAFLLTFYPRPLGRTQKGQRHCLYLSSFIPPQHLLLGLSVCVPTKFLCGDPNPLPDNIRTRGSVEGMRSWRDTTTKDTLGDSLFPQQQKVSDVSQEAALINDQKCWYRSAEFWEIRFCCL